jgi:CRP/FNR family transcriptional regulator
MAYISEITRDLRRLPCLSGLKEEELSLISEQARIKRFLKNDILFRESELANFLFVVKTGRIKLFKTSPEGRELIIKIMGPQEYFCCAPLYVDGKYPVSAAAMVDSILVVIPAEDFKEIISASVSEMGLRIIKGLCSRIKHLSTLVEELSFRDVEQRVMMTLLRMAEEESPEDNVVSLTVTHQDIASITGSVRVVVSRTMSKLKREGAIVDTNIRGFKIDKEKLFSLLISKIRETSDLSY